jgi:hypothetical protein
LINRLLLDQSRRGIAEHIAQSPHSFTVQRRPMISDGFGGQCEDITGSPVSVTIICRLSRESRIVSAVQAMAGVGLDSAASMYALAPWNSSIKEGDQFSGFRVGKVAPLDKFGGVQALEAALYPSS